MIQITDHADGCVIAVRAQPGARRNAIVGEHGGMLKVAVTAPADKGRANEAIVEVLAETFGLKRAQVELISGAASRQKKILLRGLTSQNAQIRLRSVLQV